MEYAERRATGFYTRLTVSTMIDMMPLYMYEFFAQSIGSESSWSRKVTRLHPFNLRASENRKEEGNFGGEDAAAGGETAQPAHTRYSVDHR